MVWCGGRLDRGRLYDDYYDEHPDYHNETTEQEANSPDDSGLSPKSPESYPVKGGGKGMGCSVCGSRWHTASSCPVGGSKGKGFRGPAKGYGKGKKGFYRPKGDLAKERASRKATTATARRLWPKASPRASRPFPL